MLNIQNLGFENQREFEEQEINEFIQNPWTLDERLFQIQELET